LAGLTPPISPSARLIAWACVLTLLTSSGAEAGAWTKRKYDGLFIAGLGVHWLDPYDRPANQGHLKAELSVYLEYGLTDRITLVGRGAVQQLHHRIRPTKKKPAPPQSGIGGLELGARIGLMQRAAWASSVQVMAGIPGSGENWINEAFGARGGDVDIRAQLGRSLGTSAFIEAAAGVRLRGEGASNEVRLDLTAGCDFILGTRLMMQTYSVWALGPSQIGPSYTGHRLQASLLAPTRGANMAQISVLTTVNKQRMREETAFIASVWRSF
jgi:hypothetical protein